MNFLLLLVSAAYAHYQLTVPKTRGNEDAFQLDAPCAGYQKGPAVATALKSKVTVISGHEGSISYYISKTDNPKSQADFVLIKGNVSVPSVGSFSTEVDFSMPPASLVDKSTAVIQTVFDGPDGSLYQCADMIMTPSAISNAAVTNGLSASDLLVFLLLAVT